jgi:hypothetical protein
MSALPTFDEFRQGCVVGCRFAYPRGYFRGWHGSRSKRQQTPLLYYIGEALDVAKNMQAKAIVLTHFSQRYPRIPPLRTNTEIESAATSSGNIPIIFAFDFFSMESVGGLEID